MTETVTFLSDYGLADPFVGLCHAVIARIAPQVRVLDLTHGIARQDVRQGALILADAVPYLPPRVHLAVVDPGVGTARRAVVLAAGDRLLVGPDNGLLWTAGERLGGVAGAWELREAAYHVHPVSSTFHGRDVFAPAAAHLATGVAPAELGPPIDPGSLTQLTIPAPEMREDGVLTEVLAVDAYGNAQLNASAAHLSHPEGARPPVVVVRCGDVEEPAVFVTAFADVAEGTLVLLEDSAARLALAVNRGDAAARLRLAPGSQVLLRPAVADVG